MILKLNLWIESKNFSDASAEKEVLERALKFAVTKPLPISPKRLKSLGDYNYEATLPFVNLILQLQQLEAHVLGSEEVLQRMRKGIKE